MRTPRFLFGLFALLLMALAPAGTAMAASMCAMMPASEASAMPTPGGGKDSGGKSMHNCVALCAQQCQAIPSVTALPGVSRLERSATYTVAARFSLLSPNGPEPPPPRAPS